MIADETLISAEGWSQFDTHQPKEKEKQEHIDFSHKVAKVFKSREGKEVLSLMVKRYLLNDIAQDNDTQIGIGRKQGRADVVKQILAHIEISNNAK